MEIKKLEAAIEAILFTMGESVELSQVADCIFNRIKKPLVRSFKI